MDSSHQHLRVRSSQQPARVPRSHKPRWSALSPHLMPQLAPLPSARTRLGRDLSERNIIMAPNKIISIEE